MHFFCQIKLNMTKVNEKILNLFLSLQNQNLIRASVLTIFRVKRKNPREYRYPNDDHTVPYSFVRVTTTTTTTIINIIHTCSVYSAYIESFQFQILQRLLIPKGKEDRYVVTLGAGRRSGCCCTG